MDKYVETTGIYSKANYLCVRTRYNKGKGYCIEVTPVGLEKPSWSDVYIVSEVFDREYYDHYRTLVIDTIPCERKSAKKEAKNERIAEEKFDAIIQQYIDNAVALGGRKIELTGNII